VTVDDLVETKKLPQPQAQPNRAEAAGIGPAHGVQADLHDIGVIGQSDGLGIGEEAELPVFTLAIVKEDRALPASFLVVVQLAEVGDGMLSRPGLGTHTLDEGVVGMGLAVLGAMVASQKHDRLPDTKG
jgi:hypothetical protein